MIDTLKSENGKLQTEKATCNLLFNLVIESNNAQKIEINSLKENLEKSKKETKFFQEEAAKLEENLSEMSKELEETKQKYDKLHTITHGKFKSKK